MKRPAWVSWHGLLTLLVMIAASMGLFVVLAVDRATFTKSERL